MKKCKITPVILLNLFNLTRVSVLNFGLAVINQGNKSVYISPNKPLGSSVFQLWSSLVLFIPMKYIQCYLKCTYSAAKDIFGFCADMGHYYTSMSLTP